MSNIWLMLALAGTFMSIMLVFVVADMRQRERNRPMALLQSQIGPVEGSFDLRQQMEGSAFHRVVMPGAKKVGRGIARGTPFDLSARLNAQLVLAGSPEGLDVERVVAMKIIGGIAGLGGGRFGLGFPPGPSFPHAAAVL